MQHEAAARHGNSGWPGNGAAGRQRLVSLGAARGQHRPPGTRHTQQLYPGCNNISLTFPDGTPSQTVVQAVTPAGTVETLWRFNGPLNKFEGFSPAFPQASDLMSVNFLDAVWFCMSAAPGATSPPLPSPTPAWSCVSAPTTYHNEQFGFEFQYCSGARSRTSPKELMALVVARSTCGSSWAVVWRCT